MFQYFENGWRVAVGPKRDNPMATTTKKQEAGTLRPTLSLKGLIDLLEALSPELKAVGGLIPLWANELRRDLDERLLQ